MSRSRSSFDLSGAIATAASLSVVTPEEQAPAHYRGVPLVSFGPTAAGPPTRRPPTPVVQPLAEALEPEAPSAHEAEPPPSPHEAPLVDEGAPLDRSRAVDEGAPLDRSRAHSPAEVEPGPADTARRPPKLPDLSEIKSPAVRCEKIMEWIAVAVGASDVFIADAAGLPIAGNLAESEAKLAATGIVASAVAHLAAALPGNSSALFELHVGDGPFFQLIGFEVGMSSYVVGFHRPTPLGFRQAHAVRLACRHALGGNGGADPGSEA